MLHQMNSRSKLVVIKWKLINRQKHRGTSYIFDRPWLNGASSNRFTPCQSRIGAISRHRMYQQHKYQLSKYALLQTKSWQGKFNIIFDRWINKMFSCVYQCWCVHMITACWRNMEICTTLMMVRSVFLYSLQILTPSGHRPPEVWYDRVMAAL